jgi:hypothetical protein
MSCHCKIINNKLLNPPLNNNFLAELDTPAALPISFITRICSKEKITVASLNARE